MRRSLFLPVITIICILGAHQLSQAQIIGARVNGAVKDATQAVAPGATLTITNVETGINRTASSDAQGRYVFSDIAPGKYDLSCALPGFKTVVRRGLTLTIGAEVEIDLNLEVGQVAERVTVTGEASLVETQSSTVTLV